MSLKANAQRSVFVFFTYVIIDFIFHGILIADFFWNELENIARTGSEIKYIPLLLGMGYVAILFTYFMQLVPQDLKNQIFFGALLGFIFIIPYHLINYAFIFDYSLSLVIVDSIVSTLEFAIVGVFLFKYTEWTT